MLAVVLIGGGYVLYLDRLVTEQFRSLRWTLPARVYAAPVQLYAGLGLDELQLEHELHRLAYRRVAVLHGPGTYVAGAGQLTVVLRPVQFADRSRAAMLLRVGFGPAGIQDLRNGAGAQVPVVRLDPLLIGSIFPSDGVDRIVVTPEQVPPLLPAALKAIEDRTFDTNWGIDPRGILRAAWVDLRAHHLAEGGSTLTQELVRSYFLSDQRTFGRKIREAIMAVSLTAHFSKADLMNAYINEIFLGQDGNRSVHGFGLASEFYFGEPLDELDLPQIAMLVAIVRGPTYYDPRRFPTRVLTRRNLVLKLLAKRGVVSRERADAAMREPLGVTRHASGAYYPAYLDLVRRTLRRDYPERALTESGLRIYTSLDPRVQEIAEHALDAQLHQLDRTHHYGRERLQGSVVVTSPQTGDVLALVGGRDADFDGFNRALDARRSIGSLVKPFIYLTALETGQYTPASIIEDEPIAVRLATGQYWRPRNYSRIFHGPVPLVHALGDSLNAATVRLGMSIGLGPVTQTLLRFGLKKVPQEVPAMLLGASDLSPLEVAQLYNGLADGGFREPLRAVQAVVSADGRPLKAFPVRVTPVAPSGQVYALTTMMEQVLTHGTGEPAESILPPGLVAAGKTGTSQRDRDSWFAGFTGSDLAVVWVGYDHNQPTGLTGSMGALPVWAHIMASIGTLPLSMPPPQGQTDVWIDFATGLATTPACDPANAVEVAVPLGTQIPAMAGCGLLGGGG